ncbi:MAG: ASKHA domain-containing protein [Oscillospiraceae bacterium]|jgi:uncharacterized 2Fe-2S/4Fe-4S cluster protein (DUF4445 family)|nr:ASKHA domain-containing protein [Oscillospiraceae bacterium]
MNLCTSNCLACGKCAGLPVLDSFHMAARNAEKRDGYGIAVDLGTTTVAMALLDLSSGRVTARHSFLNPQRAFGADVISRSRAADEGHQEELRRVIREAVTEGISRLFTGQADDVCVAGNTVMTRLFPALPGERVLPCLSELIGGDILAGLLYVLPEGVGRFLLIDLGTNGEMALYDNGKLTLTSAAAGPAFEREGKGASNVIEECASLLRQGLIGKTGTHKTRDLQLAKSAVRAGVELLVGDTPLDAVYLAGGIGQAIAPEDAVTVGLLPPELGRKAHPVGNASLGGAVRLLLEPKAAERDMERLQAAAVSINLAEHPAFSDLFMRHIDF